MLNALHRVTGGVINNVYRGRFDWLILYGYGAPERNEARNKHVKSGRHVLLWDQGYFDRKHSLRCSIDQDHPQAWLDKTNPDPSRMNGIKLREDADPNGHIILVGLGIKTKVYLPHEKNWEQRSLDELRLRFPEREIIYRPKPGSPAVKLDCKIDAVSSIEQLLKGASLAYCRHSNVAIDAAIAGVPFECIDGAAMWLQSKPFTPENRLDFLRRVTWWNWRADEAAKAWQFIQGVTGEA